MCHKSIIRSINDISALEIEQARKTKVQILLGPDDNMPTFYTRLFTLEPGGRIPLHRHKRQEHDQVIIDGELILTLDGKKNRLRAGDVVFIPSEIAHSYENQSQMPAKFLCMIPVNDDFETVWIEEPVE